MVVRISPTAQLPKYNGVRMDAGGFLAISDDDSRYELIDGVVVMSPSPTRDHQRIVTEILSQLSGFLREHPVGEALPDIDVQFSGEHVYRPDIIFVRADRLAPDQQVINVAPDAVFEVLSPSTEAKDTKTKFTDYARFGVGEYWIVDPDGGEAATPLVRLYRLSRGKYKAVAIRGAAVQSEAIEGFTLDLAALKKVLRPSR